MLLLSLGCGSSGLSADEASMAEALALAGTEPEQAVQIVLAIDDPVVRSAALHHLALDPQVKLTLEQTQRLCAMAPTDPERQVCLTRFNASHLAPYYGTAPPDGTVPPDAQ